MTRTWVTNIAESGWVSDSFTTLILALWLVSRKSDGTPVRWRDATESGKLFVYGSNIDFRTSCGPRRSLATLVRTAEGLTALQGLEEIVHHALLVIICVVWRNREKSVSEWKAYQLTLTIPQAWPDDIIRIWQVSQISSHLCSLRICEKLETIAYFYRVFPSGTLEFRLDGTKINGGNNT